MFIPKLTLQAFLGRAAAATAASEVFFGRNGDGGSNAPMMAMATAVTDASGGPQPTKADTATTGTTAPDDGAFDVPSTDTAPRQRPFRTGETDGRPRLPG